MTRTATPEAGFTRIPISHYDSVGGEVHALVMRGVVIEGRLSIAKLESAFYELQARWPILAARIHRDRSYKPKSWAYDVPDQAKLDELRISEASGPASERAFFAQELPGMVRDNFAFETGSSLPQFRPTILESHERADVWASNAPKSVEVMIKNRRAVFSMHVTLFADATLVAICTPHLFCDGFGAREIIRTYQIFVNGGGDDIKPLERLGEDMFAALATTKDEPEPPRANGFRILSFWDLLVFLFYFLIDLFNRPPSSIEHKEVYLPAHCVKELTDQAAQDLRSEGPGPDGKAKWVSSGDVLSAWVLKNSFVAQEKSKRPFTLLSPANIRFRPPVEGCAALPKPYLHNAYLPITTPDIPVSEVTSLSLGQLAYIIRSSLASQTTDEAAKASLKWRLANYGKSQGFCAPRAYWQSITNWRAFKYLDIQLEGALEPGQTGDRLGKAVKVWAFGRYPLPMRNGACLVADDPAGGVWVGTAVSKKEWADPRGWGRFVEPKEDDDATLQGGRWSLQKHRKSTASTLWEASAKFA